MELFSHMVVPFLVFEKPPYCLLLKFFEDSSRHLSCVFQETSPCLGSLSLLYGFFFAIFFFFFLQSLAPAAWSPAERERE